MAGALVYHPKLTGDKLLPNVFQTHPAGSGAFYSVYECADSNWVQLGCVHVGFITTAATVMGIQDVVNESRFNRGRPPQDTQEDRELRAIVAQVIRTKPYAEWASIFDAADVPFAQARLTEESLDDPQVAANSMVIELQDPEVGPLVQMGCLSNSQQRLAGYKAHASCQTHSQAVCLTIFQTSHQCLTVSLRQKDWSIHLSKVFVSWKLPT